MNVCHVLAVLFALIAGTPALTLLSPVRVAQRVVPAVMIAIALGLWFLPTGVVTAVALVPVAAWISARLGIQHAENEPVNVAPAVELAKRTTQKLQKRVRKAKPVEITRFVDRAYPDPDKAAEDESERTDAAAVADDDLDNEDVTESELSPAEAVRGRLEKITRDPRLPSKVRGDLASYPGLQRPGLRQQHTPVRKFVPAL